MKKKDLIDIILNNKNCTIIPLLFEGRFGLEEENLRVDRYVNISQSPHPKIFGDKLKNSYITVDFSESQIEMVTRPLPSITKLYNEIKDLNDSILLSLDNEYLWPQSIPPLVPEDSYIPIANFDNSKAGIEARQYREFLAKKYGKHLQLLSGIHFNFSLSEDFIKKIYLYMEEYYNFNDLKNYIYLRIARNYIRNRWLIIFLMGASSIVHHSYFEKCIKDELSCHLTLKELDSGYLYSDEVVSFRHSRCGYKNKEELHVSFNSLEQFIEDIEGYIKKGKLISYREFYSPIRIKHSEKKKGEIDNLRRDGIEYLEIRTIDLNPYRREGVDLYDLHFLHLFLIYCLLSEDREITEDKEYYALRNHELTAMNGRMERIHIYDNNGKYILLKEKAITILNNIEKLILKLNFNVKFYKQIINFQREKISNYNSMYPSKLIKDAITTGNYIDMNLSIAKKYTEEAKKRIPFLKNRMIDFKIIY